jgi:Flp pilus assembly protein TadG
VERKKHGRHERGQVLVIVALGLVVIVAMVGVVIDGGYAWGKQRETQNGADSAAEAGATVLAMNVAGVVPAKTDADVLAAVDAAATANGITADAWYTNIGGGFVNSSGATVGSKNAAAVVGDGTIPPNAAGVHAEGSQTFDTFLARVVGFSTFTATTSATAAAGYLGGTCSADAGCFVLPVTIPVNVLTCDPQNDPQLTEDQWMDDGTVYVIPLCQNGPGNVGWLDWTPTAGGTSELEDAITDPNNPALTWPGWYYVTATGNVNSAGVEAALNAYSGALVQFPQFDGTCNTEPSGPDPTALGACPEENVGGNGSNQWYHLAGMGTFQFCSVEIDACADYTPQLTQGAYVNGNNSAVCDTGNGATSCLAGVFADINYEGSVQAAPGPNDDTANVGVQLIR